MMKEIIVISLALSIPFSCQTTSDPGKSRPNRLHLIVYNRLLTVVTSSWPILVAKNVRQRPAAKDVGGEESFKKLLGPMDKGQGGGESLSRRPIQKREGNKMIFEEEEESRSSRTKEKSWHFISGSGGDSLNHLNLDSRSMLQDDKLRRGVLMMMMMMVLVSIEFC